MVTGAISQTPGQSLGESQAPPLSTNLSPEWSAEAQLHAYILVVAVGVNDLLGVIKYKYLLNVVLFQEITYLFNYVIVPWCN